MSLPNGDQMASQVKKGRHRRNKQDRPSSSSSTSSSHDEDADDRCPSPQRRRLIIPLPDSPASSDSPLTTSDSECSPMIKTLDPAHRPSPRAIHALKMHHPPLTVIRESQPRSSWIRHSTPPSAPRPNGTWRPIRRTSFSTDDHSFHGSYSPLWNGGGHGDQVDYHHQRSKSFRCLKSFIFIGAAVSVALLITAFPSVFLTQALFQTDETLSLFQNRPEITIPMWFATSAVFLIVVFMIFFGVRCTVRRYKQRLASLEEAVQFARETMPGYDSTNAAGNHARLAFLDLVRHMGR